MVYYKCIRCGYQTDHKSKMKKHLQRKRLCNAVLGNYSLEEMFEFNFRPINRNSELYPHFILTKMRIKNEFGDKNEDKMRIYENIGDKNEDMMGMLGTKKRIKEDIKLDNKKTESTICKYCKKGFSSYKNKWRHERYNCKHKIDKNIPIKIPDNFIESAYSSMNVKLLIQKLEEKDKQINELIQRSKTDIKSVLPYERTNKCFITDEMISNCMEKQNRCVSEMIKLVHFNDKHPENMNIVIKNMRNKYLMVFNGKDWICHDRDEMLDQIIKDNEKLMQQKFIEWFDNAKLKDKYENALNKFEKYLSVSSNQNLIDDVKKELKLMCYNYKENHINSNDYIVTEF